MTCASTTEQTIDSIAKGKRKNSGEKSVDSTTSTFPLERQYTVRGFMRFLRMNPWDMVLSTFLLLMGYELKMFGNSYSIDTEAMIQVQSSLYRSWIGLERFGLLLLKKMLGLYWYNNALASFLTVVCLLVAALLWAYLFSGVTNFIGKYHPVYFVGPFVTSPVLAEMLGFSLMGAEVGIAIGFAAIALMCLMDFVVSKKWWMGFLTVLFATVSFSLYLAMVTVFIAGFAMVFILLFWDNSKFTLARRFVFIGVGAGFFCISYLLYVVANVCALKICHMTTNPYISEQSRWGKDSVHHILQSISLHAASLYSGKGIYYSKVFTCLLALFIVIILISVFRHKVDVLTLIVSLCLCLSPMMMSIILGSAPSVRTEMSYPLMFAFAVVFLVMWTSDLFNGKIAVKYVAVVLAFILSWSQALIVNRIFYTEAINHQQDAELAQDIRNRIDELGVTDQSKETLVFLNYHPSACNSDCFTSDQLGLVGRSLFEVTVSPEQGTFVKTNFMNIMGNKFKQASKPQLQSAEKVGAAMPHWPAPGSVAKKGDLIIVNF